MVKVNPHADDSVQKSVQVSSNFGELKMEQITIAKWLKKRKCVDKSLQLDEDSNSILQRKNQENILWTT